MSDTQKIRSILIATDLTQHSVDTIRHAAELAIAASARLHVIHVHEEPSPLSGEPKDILTIQRQVHEKRAELHDLLGEILPPSVALDSVRVEVGPPAGIILREANEVSADLIVLGKHRHRGFADRFIGSIAEAVLRQATVPCLVLSRPLAAPIRQVLVPNDLSEPARAAIGSAISWTNILGQPQEANITVAHVLDPANKTRREGWVEQELRKDLTDSAQVAALAAESDIPIDVKILRGADPADELIREAEESAADLIVLGTHGDRVLVRALLGSVSSEMVRRAPAPVMIVPPPNRIEGERSSAGPARFRMPASV